MIGAEVSAFFKVSKAFKHAPSNSKGTSLAKRLVSGYNTLGVRFAFWHLHYMSLSIIFSYMSMEHM
jgi:hypothetical protein